MGFEFIWIEMRRFAVCTDESLGCEINDIGQAAVLVQSAPSHWEAVKKYLIRCLRQGNFFFVRRSICMENSSNIVPLFVALSHVM